MMTATLAHARDAESMHAQFIEQKPIILPRTRNLVLGKNLYPRVAISAGHPLFPKDDTTLPCRNWRNTYSSMFIKSECSQINSIRILIGQFFTP